MFAIPTGISPEKELSERSRVVTDGIKEAMLVGKGPEKLFLESSRPVRSEQFLIPRGNSPTRP